MIVEGKQGTLYVLTGSELFQMAQKVAQTVGGRHIELQKASNGFVQRLNAMKPRRFLYLRGQNEQVAEMFPMLRRRGSIKPFGIFIEDEE